MSKQRLAIMIGRIRPIVRRSCPQWIEEIARPDYFEVELIDLKDYPMPLSRRRLRRSIAVEK